MPISGALPDQRKTKSRMVVWGMGPVAQGVFEDIVRIHVYVIKTSVDHML